jgi:hypothetical protein
MVFTSPLTPHLTSVFILILIGKGILLTAALLLAFGSLWGTLLFLGAVRNNIFCLALALRQSTVLWLILPLNFSLFVGCWKIWVLHIFHRLSYIVTIVVLFRLRIIMFSMSAPSILRLIFILCVIICLPASCVFSQLVLLIRLLTSLRRLSSWPLSKSCFQTQDGFYQTSLSLRRMLAYVCLYIPLLLY